MEGKPGKSTCKWMAPGTFGTPGSWRNQENQRFLRGALAIEKFVNHGFCTAET